MDDQNMRTLGRFMPIILAVVAIGFIAVRGCQTGPFGRKQVVALNPEQESRLGAQAFGEVLSKSDVVTGGPVVDAVKGVANDLIEATRDENFLQATHQKAQRYEEDGGPVQLEADAAWGGEDHSSVSAAASAAGASPSAAASPSAGTAASAAGTSSSILSSRLCTILTTRSSGSSSTVTPAGTFSSLTRISASISSSGVMSTSNASGMSDGKHSTRIACMG